MKTLRTLLICALALLCQSAIADDFKTVRVSNDGGDLYSITYMTTQTDGLGVTKSKKQTHVIQSKDVAFSSGSGVIVRDIRRLNKLLATQKEAIWLPNHTSVPSSLRTMLKPSTIVILKAGPPEKENPIFASQDEQSLEYHMESAFNPFERAKFKPLFEQDSTILSQLLEQQRQAGYRIELLKDLRHSSVER